MPDFRNTFSELVARVREDHARQRTAAHGGHDFEHAYAVAQYGSMIAEDKKTAKLAWIAGICHNTDRIFPNFSDDNIKDTIGEYLQLVPLDEVEKQLIIEAVLNHSKKNDPHDNSVAVALKDADRIGNAGALVCLRSAQLYAHLPPVDYAHFLENPSASFRNPLSVLKDLHYALEWEAWLRLPKARMLGKRKFDFIRMFIQEVEFELREAGLMPYPYAPKE